MNFTILVMGAAYGTQNASTAFLFCQSLVTTKHKLYSVFFYCDGVLNANKMNTPASDEFNLTKAWQELSKKYYVNLYVCIGSAFRRGVTNNVTMNNVNDKQNNLAIGFQLSGLVELAYSIKICDRIVQF
ncbi:MAG: sulfurtransferase complex subunit TusD [Buchnera aphidicola (Pentalonia nigronervosa)]|uniref:Sulfurtransferase TusD n=1 Tax=Buchnera aphidicola (Pentalonia nigronervosa) TaxID=1309793 RepID=A0A7H1AZ01_9GAMM|nr:MAG: sulfurtransferase complex subunit TusD [Buchnera aphidicola (Pentalonia nigronervosa)]